MKRSIFVGLAVAATLFISACGSSDDSPSVTNVGNGVLDTTVENPVQDTTVVSTTG